MSAAKVEAILDDFAAAAGRAREAGFDGVQFHGAHGYLMNQFLSPLYNFRSDEWGGSAAGRQRFYLEVIRRARRAVGPDYPLMVKFGVQDDLAAGLTLGEGLELAGTMVTAGIDAIEVSSGADGIRLKKNPDHERANYRPRTAAVKRAVSGIRSLEMARSLMESGDADMVSMCRSFIRESGVVARWQTGDAARSPCIDCDKCTQGIARGVLPLECGEERRLREAAEVASGPLRPKE